MPLNPPKRIATGFFLAQNPPVSSPRIQWTTDGKWVLSDEWVAWAQTQRAQLLGELLGHGNWFSKPPRRDILEPIFSPWTVANTLGGHSLFCKPPEIPGEAGSSGSALWNLQGLMMSSLAITPVWAVAEVVQDETQDTISLFGDGDTVDADDDAASASGAETREIQLDDIESAPPGVGAGTTYIRTRGRDWEARKFLAKERVREARLKAQVAAHLARKEESRFYEVYGELEDAESRFSDYDLTDTEDEDSTSGDESAA